MASEGQLNAVEACRQVNTKTIVSDDGQSKTCTKCGEMRHMDDYHVLKRGILGRNAWCKFCMAIQKAAWDEANQERKRVTQRAYYEANSEMLKEKGRQDRIKAYGITLEEYDEMCLNGCWICGSDLNLHIDHDHSCCPDSVKSCGNCVRGVLCSNCNSGLGMFGDDLIRMQKAIEYLLVNRRNIQC